ncbi:vesicle transport through interaction with t-SNAREs homolog 1B-like [Ctenocephalides felis]|uniref:vesicle transport through interaction with t-SNAREs homolog 1B-like n=1 Tax=Ctenocephalides felis TaxID=7515 RepID=UPI000E6E145A|nr:vesicle transport through interaction with t-SNAREs homolog 1B-like [Ctenocephalides felis]
MNSNFDYDWDNVNRRTVLEGVSALERTSDSLARSHQIAIETEEVGTTIITELGEQRESLLRSKNRLVRTDEELSKTQRALNSIKKNVLTNKLILVLLIVLETAILSGLVYLKFLR